MTYNDKAHKTAIEKYGGAAGYSAEMRRRAGLRKTFAPGDGGFRKMQQQDPERFAKLIAEREAKRAKNQNRQSRQTIQPLDKE